MVFKKFKDKRGNEAFEVYSKLVKPSHRLGIISWGNPKVWKPSIPNFTAWGPEIMFMNQELRKIADKIDEMTDKGIKIKE